ncbi:NUDIX domain-containing protein [Butyrivibrio sp. AC2005]|uniref:NUDIX domain-containing protein n=1 Tax=Butyrivibrio sp. AC2005 TaxID=1280672 RepID=UPI0003FF8A5F|nr:NUDIX hydrolase [Butyrivibrio sp. AC2005]
MNNNAKVGSIDYLVSELNNRMISEGIDPRKGLPESLFLLTASLTPIPNVDLFVTDSNKRFLLSWRDDKYYGCGWHIPGGCIRMLETFEERVQKTAIEELGTSVICDNNPVLTVESLTVKDRFAENTNLQRTHNICMLFECKLPEGYSIDGFNAGKTEKDQGYLRWFDYLPEDFLDVQVPLYKEFIERWLESQY